MCATCESIAGATGDETTPTTRPDAAVPETQESRQVGVNLDTCAYKASKVEFGPGSYVVLYSFKSLEF